MEKKSDKNGWEDLAKKFNVSPEICEKYHQFYGGTLLPRKEKSYLASLLYVVESLIDEKIKDGIEKERRKNPSEQKDDPPLLRRYNIILSDKPPASKDINAYTTSLPHGAIIIYDPKTNEKEIYTTIVHQLGNLLLEHGILPGGADDESLAALFAHFVSDGVTDDQYSVKS